MSFDRSYPRRRVLAVFAGVAACVAAPGSFAVRAASDARPATGAAVDAPDLATAFRAVRAARRRSARQAAFERLEVALLAREGAAHGSASFAPVAVDRAAGLYRGANPMHVVTRTIMRELAATPRFDRRWMRRFADLERLQGAA